MRLDGVEQKLLSLLQTKFPLTTKPYADLGLSLDITEDEVIQHIQHMKVKDSIRQISPVLDARGLGYKTTLVAMRVKQAHINQAATLLVDHLGVSHAYERDHHFNLWFTLSVPATTNIDSELLRLKDMIEAEAIFDLPVVKTFKLRTYFSSDEDDQPEVTSGAPDAAIRHKVYLSPIDRKVINELQHDLPLISQPFAEMSARTGMHEEKFLEQCRALLARGIIRRFGASVNHRRVGFSANAMTCWAVPEETVEILADKLVPLRQVSHCYERKTNPLWHHNLFAMIHGHTKDQCQEIADKVSVETNLADCVLLFSTREIKKTRVIYRV